MGEGVAARLRARLADGAGTAAERARAERLAARLEAPLRLAFVGPGLAGRATTAEALIGAAVLPDGADRPTLEIVHGPEGAQARRADGTVAPAADVAAALDDPEVVMLTLSRPATALRRLSLLDVVTETSPQEMAAALAWVAGRADLVVWWADAFAAPERAVWAGRPPALRDHGFLAVRDAEALAAPNPEAVAAVAMAGEGPARLAGALSEHITGGRQADEDAARLVLQGLERTAPAAAPRSGTGAGPGAARARPVTTPFGVSRRGAAQGGAADAQASAGPRPSAGEAMARDTGPARTRHAGQPGTAPAPAGGTQETAPRSPAGTAEAHAARRALVLRAGAHLRQRSRALLDAVEARAEPGPDVARHCLDTLERLTEILEGEGPDGDPEIAALSDRLAEAEETLVLLDIEGPGPAQIDAVGLMLQLQRDLAARLPA